MRIKAIFGQMFILLSICLIACNEHNAGKTKQSIYLLSREAVDESGGNVIHNITPFFNTFSDSVVSMWLGEMRYNLYNAFTGKIIKEIRLDTAIIPELLRLEKEVSNRNYRDYSVQDYQTFSIVPFEINGLNKRQDSVDVYFALNVVSDTNMEYKDERIDVVEFRVVHFVASYDQEMKHIGSIKKMMLNDEQPQFQYGGGIFGIDDGVLTLNTKGSDTEQEPGKHGMLCKIVSEGNRYLTQNVNLPYDSTARKNAKSLKMTIMSYSTKAEKGYFVSDGNRIMYYVNDSFNDLGIRIKGELIQSIKFNKSKNILYLSTRQSLPKDTVVESRLYALKLNTKEVQLLDSKKEYSSIQFLSDSTFVSLAKNEQTGQYEFSTYQIK